MKKIVFTGGGTAGHIIPNLAIIEELKGYDIYYLGSSGMEKEILLEYPNVKFIEIETVKFIRSLTLKNLLIPYKLYRCIKSTKEKLKEINPSIIFSKGGYVSIPTCIAGSQLKIPILTHESDLSIGLANKIIAKKSKALLCTFEETAKNYKKNAIYTGSPIKQNITQGKKEIILNRHKINNSKPIVLIIGGSLGSKHINSVIQNNLKVLTNKYNILHIVGKKNFNENIKEKDYYQIDFAHDIENYFSASDIIISRAGSNAIFEIVANQKSNILIPLPKKNSRGDQIDNAKSFQNKGISEVIFQEDLTIDLLLTTIDKTLQNKETYIKNMKKLNISKNNQIFINLIHKYSL